MVAIALYQPDIAQNTGTILRTGACLGVPVHIIRPMGFDLSERRLKRAGMDYLDLAELTVHDSWAEFLLHCGDRRIVLATTRASVDHMEMSYRADDFILVGRESSGVPEAVHHRAEARIRIPMKGHARSLNVAVVAAIVVAEALRQTTGFGGS